jgi:hypothetical protein
VFWQARTQDAAGTLYASETQQADIPQGNRVPNLDVVVHDGSGSAVAGGYLLGAVTNWLNAPIQSITTVAIWRASDGVAVWWWDLPDGWVTVSPAWSDHSAAVRYDAYAIEAEGGTEGHFVQLDGTATTSDLLLDGHHNAIETLPGQWAWIASDMHLSDDHADLSNRIYTAPVGDTSAPVELFNEFDSIYGGVAPTHCAHQTLPSLFVDGLPLFDWTHTNSITYAPGSDSLYVYGRYMDALWKLDRATGALQWQLGGPGGDFTTVAGGSLWDSSETSVLWSHAHMTDVWDGGALAFDNGDHADPKVSSVVEIAWDEQARTASEVWRYTHPAGAFMFVLGDARRTPEDTVLISWTMLGEVTEVDRSGAVLWEATVPGGLDISRVRHVNDLYDILARAPTTR